jgi:ABC-type enterochelin transport system permease subunit
MATERVKKTSRIKPDLAWLIWIFIVVGICSALFGPMTFLR